MKTEKNPPASTVSIHAIVILTSINISLNKYCLSTIICLSTNTVFINYEFLNTLNTRGLSYESTKQGGTFG